MACCGGCGGGSSTDSPVLLSGVLESRYADASSIPPPLPEVAAADVTGMFSSGGFWVALLFIGIAAYCADKAKRESE